MKTALSSPKCCVARWLVTVGRLVAGRKLVLGFGSKLQRVIDKNKLPGCPLWASYSVCFIGVHAPSASPFGVHPFGKGRHRKSRHRNRRGATRHTGRGTARLWPLTKNVKGRIWRKWKLLTSIQITILTINEHLRYEVSLYRCATSWRMVRNH